MFMPEMMVNLVMKEGSMMQIILLRFDEVGEGSFSFDLQNLVRQLGHHEFGQQLMLLKG